MVNPFIIQNRRFHTESLEYSFGGYSKFLDIVNDKIVNRSYKENKLAIIKYLAINGKTSTWKIGDILNISSKNAAENYARRIIVGRENRRKKILGLIDLGIVEQVETNKAVNYHLSTYGMLFAIKLFDFTSREWRLLAKSNSEMFQMIFGKIDYLQKNKINLNILKIFAEGNFSKITRSIMENLFYTEMLNILLKDFPVRFSVSKQMFSVFVSYWFYTYLYYYMVIQKKQSIKKWLNLIKKEPHLKMWYYVEAKSAFDFYLRNHQKSESIMLSIIE